MCRFHLICFAVLFYSLLSLAAGQNTADYMLVEDVRPLVLFNEYEQQLSQQDKEQLLHGNPYRVRQNRVYLSDDFSTASAVEIQGRKLLVLLDSEGEIKNQQFAGKIFFLENTEQIMDTFRVIRPAEVFIRDPFTGTRYPTLNKDELVLRIFRHRGGIYVRVVDQPVFGWLETSGRRALEKFVAGDPMKNVFSAFEISQTEKSVRRTNQQLVDLFSYLNKRSGQTRTPPQWVLQISETKIECAIDSYTAEFDQSGLQLQQELISHLSRRDFIVKGSTDHFVIELKN